MLDFLPLIRSNKFLMREYCLVFCEAKNRNERSILIINNYDIKNNNKLSNHSLNRKNISLQWGKFEAREFHL